MKRRRNRSGVDDVDDEWISDGDGGGDGLGRILSIGIDPGKLTGLAFLLSDESERESNDVDDDRGWRRIYNVLQLNEMSYDAILNGGVSSAWKEGDWWGLMSSVGTELANYLICGIQDWLVEESDMHGNDEWGEQIEGGGGGSFWGPGLGGGGDSVGARVLIVMEDFILRPGNGVRGIGGRDAIIPVALGAVLWSRLVGVLGNDIRVEFLISPPSAKAVITDEFLKSPDMYGLEEAAVRGGKGHAKDALRHAILGIRSQG